MFIVDCHCDTLSELYKQNKSLYANDLMLDAERIIKNGGGLQFMAMFIPTDIFRAGAGATYTLKLIDTYLRGLRELEQKGLNVNRVLTKEDLKKLPNGQFNTMLAIEEGGALDGSLEVLRVYYELGVRCMTLEEQPQRYCRRCQRRMQQRRADHVRPPGCGGDEPAGHRGGCIPHFHLRVLGCAGTQHKTYHRHPFLRLQSVRSSP